MPTRIVHCKVHCYDVLIDRRTELGNPFIIGKHGNRSEVIAQFRKYAEQRILTDPHYRDTVRGLHGKTLACWCCLQPVDSIRPHNQQICHGEVLAEISQRLNEPHLQGESTGQAIPERL